MVPLSPSSDRVALLQVRSILQQLGLEGTCDDSIIVKEAGTHKRMKRFKKNICLAIIVKIVLNNYKAEFNQISIFNADVTQNFMSLCNSFQVTEGLKVLNVEILL